MLENSRRRALRSTRPIAFAHRGGAALWPENTLPAFQGALDLGCPFLETDLHLTRDGEIVVFHDARLERTTDGQGLLRDLTLAELRRLDAGYRFTMDGASFPFRGQGLVVPTLAEVVELSAEARFNVEIKQRGPALTAALWRFIETRALEDRFVVAAARDALIRAFREVSKGRVATSAGSWEARLFWAATRLGFSGRLPVDYDALQLPVTTGPLTVVDERLVGAAHARGLAVHVWTIDDADEMRRLVALGVDGIMSDRPDVLVEVLGTGRSELTSEARG